MARKKGSATSRKPRVPLADKLVLNQWVLSLFNVKRFEELAEHLRDEALEGLDENNVHHFHRALIARLINLPQLRAELLLEYDQNIVRHTQRLNERRIARGEKPIVWKYFQYLALLFCEIYLDRYFRDPRGLLAELNVQVAACNRDRPEVDQIAVLDEASEAWPQLNKLAFWMATGSGKTLLMHANMLQYRHALTRHGRRRELNRVLLLTPNEGLSQQHLREFETAGVAAELFNKDGRGLFRGHAVEILEVTRLRDEMGDKIVAIDAFEGNNLVLVDEGHRGASRGEEGAWMYARNALCKKGFSFEYSATFGAIPSSLSFTPRARCATIRTAISMATVSARIIRFSILTGERNRTIWSCTWWLACSRSSSSSGCTASKAVPSGHSTSRHHCGSSLAGGSSRVWPRRTPRISSRS